jgi:hypothetical protein
MLGIKLETAYFQLQPDALFSNFLIEIDKELETWKICWKAHGIPECDG